MNRRVAAVTCALLACVLAAPGPARAAPVTIDFEGIATGSGTQPALAAYLAGFGVTISAQSHAGAVVAMDETVVYGGGVVNAPSGVNYLTIEPGGAVPTFFDLSFAGPVDNLSFDFAAVLAPSIVPQWSATAFDVLDNVLGSVGDVFKGGTFPVIAYAINATGITRVRFAANGSGIAAFSGPLIDNLRFTAVPEPGVLALAGVALVVAMVRRRRREG